MRVAIGGFAHETNTFHPRPTTLAAFQGPAGTWLHGQAIVDAFARHAARCSAACVDARREQRLDARADLLRRPPADHRPDRPPRPSTHPRQSGSSAGRRATPAPTGCCCTCTARRPPTGSPDPEAHVLRAVRAAVGPSVPIVVVYDLHANIGPDWAEHADAIIGYKTAPHTDFYERGVDGAVVLRPHPAPARSGRSWRLAKPPILIKAGLMSHDRRPAGADQAADVLADGARSGAGAPPARRRTSPSRPASATPTRPTPA